MIFDVLQILNTVFLGTRRNLQNLENEPFFQNPNIAFLTGYSVEEKPGSQPKTKGVRILFCWNQKYHEKGVFQGTLF